MLDRHLVIGCEPLDDPFTSKASNPAVLFASEWGVRPVIHAAVLDMSHTASTPNANCNARALSPDTTALESPNSVSFATRRASASPYTVMTCALALTAP